MNITVEQFIEKRDSLQADLDKASEAMKPFKKYRGGCGLLPDEVRKTPEYQAAKKGVDLAMLKLRDLNGSVSNGIKRAARKQR